MKQTTWEEALNQIEEGSIDYERIKQLFQSWAESDDEIEQKEILKIIESLDEVVDSLTN